MKFKDPDSTAVPYSVDWQDELGPGNHIVLGSFTAECEDTSISIDSIDHDETVSTVFLTGGTAGTIVEIRHRIDSSDGRESLDKTQRIKIRNT